MQLVTVYCVYRDFVLLTDPGKVSRQIRKEQPTSA